MSFTKKIVAGQTIAAADFAKFFGDHFSEFVKTGFEVTEGTGLIVDISAGTAYVKDADGYMFQIVSGATETTTLADDSTNYIFLHSNNGATYITDSTSSTVPDDAILLATVVTASGDVTTVTDGRDLNPRIVSEHLYYVKGTAYLAGSSETTYYLYLNPFLDKTVTIKKIKCHLYSVGYIMIYYTINGTDYVSIKEVNTTAGEDYSDTLNVSGASAAADVGFKVVIKGNPSGISSILSELFISYETL